jgi:hypothetical protein
LRNGTESEAVMELDQMVAEQYVSWIAAAWVLVTLLLVGASTIDRRREQRRERRMIDG